MSPLRQGLIVHECLGDPRLRNAVERLALRRRHRLRYQGTWINALIGAAITLGLSFTGLPPLLGGGVAGYLQQESPERGAKVSAISGVIATVPLLFSMVVGFGLFAAVPVDGVGMPGGIELMIMLFLMLPMLLLWFVGLSAAGGYLGAYIRRET